MKSDLKYILAYLALPNIAFAVFGQFIFFARPLVVVDYVLIAFLSLFISRLNVGVLIGLILALDITVAIAPAYHMQGMDFVRNAYAVFLMSWSQVLLSGALMLMSVVLLVKIFNLFLSRMSRISSRNVVAVGVVAVFLLFVDVVNGSNMYIQSSYNLIGENIAGSNAHKLFSAISKALKKERMPLAVDVDNVPPATRGLRDLLAQNRHPLPSRILVVVVESWGQPISTNLQDIITKPFFSEAIRSRYLVRRGEVPFAGSTVSGEIRELCGQLITSPSQVDAVSKQNCLPKLLKSLGYETTALHGFSRYMFGRHSWYPLLGFDRMLFADDLQAAGYTSRCGHVFRGSCDSDIAAYVQQLLKKKPVAGRGISENPQFVYWLTLNTHLPVSRDTTIEQKIDCAAMIAPIDREDHEEHCRLSKLLLGTLGLVADIAEKTEEDLQVIVVGDHAPPFVFKRDRELYKPGVVPFVELVPTTRRNTDG